MNLKMALATLGVSLTAASAAFAQGAPVTLVADPANYTLGAAPGLVEIDGTFTFTGTANDPTVFAVPLNYNLASGTGYSTPSNADGGLFPLIALNLVPLPLAGSPVGGAFTSFNGPILQLAFDGTAASTTGTVFYDIYNADPTIDPAASVIGTVSTPFSIGGTAVPEPGTVALLVGMGIAGVTLRRRRK